MMAVIEAKGVSIRYIAGDLKNIGLKEYFMRRINGEYSVTEFWADKDITFSLEKGDMLGIIGTNGAGKSTLLKAISGIMRPTHGTMKVNGKIAALLELASGFDGNLTVKENTYLRGAMLGYTRKFMDEQYENIIEFAELQDFQDRLFKQLSSGMKSRLAFAIACLVQPDIIILDEVLSVGDGAFKEKSAKKMKSILDSGVTGIIVSHSIKQVREMCNKILWLDHGRQVGFSDKVDLLCDAYEEYLQNGELPKSEDDIIKSAKKQQQLRAENEEKKHLQIAPKAKEEHKIFSLNTMCADPNNRDIVADVICKYLQNCNTARIDIKNEGYANNDIKFETISDENILVTTPSWFNKNGNGTGYVIESNVNMMEFNLKIIGNGLLKLWLRAKDVRYDGVNRIPIWMEYKTLIIDDEPIISNNMMCSHDKPFLYSFNVQDGQSVKFYVEFNIPKLME